MHQRLRSAQGFIKLQEKTLKMSETENKLGNFSILFCITFSHPLNGLSNEVVLTATAANRIQRYCPFICALLKCNACSLNSSNPLQQFLCLASEVMKRYCRFIPGEQT